MSKPVIILTLQARTCHKRSAGLRCRKKCRPKLRITVNKACINMNLAGLKRGKAVVGPAKRSETQA